MASRSKSQPLKPNQTAEHELRLVDIVKVIYQRWRWIAGVDAATILLAVVFLAVTPGVYSTYSVVQIPRKPFDPNTAGKSASANDQAQQDKPIQDFASVKETIKLIHAPQSRPEVGSLPSPVALEFESADPWVYSMSMKVTKNAIPAALDWFRAINERVVSVWQQDYSNRKKSVELLKEQLQIKDKRLTSIMESLVKERASASSRLAKQNIDSQIALMKNELQENELGMLNFNNMIVQLSPSFTVLGPFVSDSPVSPKPKVIIAIGILFGGVLGLFAAFSRDFWLKNRDTIRDRDT